MSKKIAIIGAGISGLSCAYLLSENKNHNITVFAKEFSPNITSNRAAAFWFPYHVRNDKRAIKWSKSSYAFYKQLTTDDATGISMKKLIKAIPEKLVEEDNSWIEFIPEGECTTLPAEELKPDIKKAYAVTVPLIETQIFLPYLQHIFEQRNVVFERKRINSFDEIPGFDILINCSGLGSRDLCHDTSVIPVRGQVALLQPQTSLPIYLDNDTPLYIVPRKDATIVGGTYEADVYEETTEPETIGRILQTAYAFFPELKQKKVIGNWAGLRPFRPRVRVEHEAGTNIIHNYGHAGSGFTLSFGCAEEVTHLVDDIN